MHKEKYNIKVLSRLCYLHNYGLQCHIKHFASPMNVSISVKFLCQKQHFKVNL